MRGGWPNAKPTRQSCIAGPTCYRLAMPAGLRLIALGGVVLLGACDRPQNELTKPSNAPTVLASLTAVEPPLTRAELLLAVMKAGSAVAAGRDDGAEQRDLAGKRFALRLRFGCASEPPADRARTATFDAEARVVKLSFPAEIGIQTPNLGALAGGDIEAVEGFWIRRPWLLEPACALHTEPAPAAADGSTEAPSLATAATTAAVPHVGLAQIFMKSDARTHRRERRAYQATERLGSDEGPSGKGYDLVITGRLRALATEKVIACVPAEEGAPSCMISASFDSVSIRRADTDRLIGEWPSG